MKFGNFGTEGSSPAASHRKETNLGMKIENDEIADIDVMRNRNELRHVRSTVSTPPPAAK